MLLLLALTGANARSQLDECCWCDKDTPAAQSTFVGSDSNSYQLVFSDEFNKPGRKFSNGQDTKWTALEIGDTSNNGAAFYLPEQATIVTDNVDGSNPVSALQILTGNKSHVGESPTGGESVHMPYRSAMLQSWNKFCFTGGIVEFRARQPSGGGYWPALWLFGNLGRAVYQNSNTGLWPWSYNECDPDLELAPTNPPQRISACDDHDFEAEGLLPFQGRGATEIDILEGAVTNSGKHSYVVGSLQLSPAIPPYFKPPWNGFPTASGPGSWYTGLTFGRRGKANSGWYGPAWGSGCPTGCPDALSGGLLEQDDLDTRYWTYRMEWKIGKNGGLGWYYDDEFIWGMSASSFGEYEICSSRDGVESCHRTPARQVPQEPMSLVMNTAIGTWNEGVAGLDNKHWPAKFFVDYVRVWQRSDAINIGCDPPDFPTRKYIEVNADLYGEAVSPLGHDTCPGIYPDAAFKHAKELQERAAAIRQKRKSSDLAQDLAVTTSQKPLTVDTVAPEFLVQDGSQSRRTLPMLLLGFAGGIAVAIGAVVYDRRRRTFNKSPGLLGGAYDEFSGPYEMAQ